MGATQEGAAGRSNVPLLNAETLFSKFQELWSNIGIDSAINNMLSGMGVKFLPSTYGTIVLVLIVTIAIKFLVDWFLKTETGLAIRATGDNKRMIRSFSANTDRLVILGLGLSNALVALSGALIAQYSKFADVGMGIGMIVIGLASVIIGEAIFGTKTIMRTTLAVVCGAIIYRIIYALALRIDFLDTGDMKLITAIIVILALVIPQVLDKRKEKKRKARRMDERIQQSKTQQGGSPLA